MNKQFRADMLLLLVVSFWGISYYLMDLSLKETRPFSLNAFRFLLAFFTAALCSMPRLKTVSRTTLRYSVRTGITLVLVYVGATFGVMYTSLSNAGFLCSLAVVFTPLFAFVFQGTAPERKLILAVVLCVLGVGMLTLDGGFAPAAGDLFCIFCAAAYAANLLITEAAVKKESVNAYQLGVFQLGVAGVIHLIMALFLEDLSMPRSPEVWFSMLFLAIFATGAAFIIQPIAQQYTSASHVGVIFTLEPVMAGAAAFFLAGEVLRPRAYGGAALLILGIFIMEADRNLFRRKRRE